jgi:hypothetical protein
MTRTLTSGRTLIVALSSHLRLLALKPPGKVAIRCIQGTSVVMATLVHTTDLRGTEDFVVESADGEIGRVEELWLGADEEPQALAVCMTDGSRALLLAEDVAAVDREHRWVVVGLHPELLELDAPRLESTGGRPTASWATTGTVVHPEPPSRPGVLQAFRRRVPNMDERPLWQLVATLYAAVALIVVFVIALVFVVSWIAGGHPY